MKCKDEEKEKQRREKISNTMKLNPKSGGYRKGSGRGKKGTYKGYWCDSSYELAWVIYHIDNNIKFERNTEKFIYTYKGEKKYYIPDFILNGVYYEIKGYEDDKVSCKLNCFPYEINILYKENMKNIFNYVENKYGRNFISQYEEKLYKNCSKCNGYIHRRNKKGICSLCISLYKKEKVYKPNKNKKVCGCGKLINFRSANCIDCSSIFQRKVERPEIEQVLNEVSKIGHSATGRKYGVSDNTIRKWIKTKI